MPDLVFEIVTDEMAGTVLRAGRDTGTTTIPGPARQGNTR
jgi:hypothetical protein